jgi:A/G-specific adenine glycosylase
MIPPTRVGVIRRRILTWYIQSGRTLPWRGERNPYRILVSEIMLQQTQVSRVLQKYREFLHRFPTLAALASATRADVVRAWQGMGYNNRAVRLHALARTVLDRYGGELPRDEAGLLQLPGIGSYTARAICSSAFGSATSVVDVNIRRVLSRAFWRGTSAATLQPVADVDHMAAILLPPRRAYDWNQALMDLGATVCTARAPRCPECPIRLLCKSRTRMGLSTPPMRKKEPTFYGIPHRIYRGRIIEYLRRLDPGRSVRLLALGKAIMPAFSSRNAVWLRTVLAGLERDGLVLVEAAAPPGRSRVRLA